MALVLMQAARLLPGSTRSAAEPTTGTTAAAASADTDEHDRVCLGGLGPCPLLLKATSEHERPAAVAAIACTACVQQVQRGARDVHGLLIAGGVGPCPLLCALLLQLIKSKRCSADCRTHGLGARHSAVAAKACCT